jgi:hypothetical protein
MSQRPYPYDPGIRALVAARLYELLPEIYRVQDEPPRGQGELQAFLRVLAAPLAAVRQNIEELYADLFIDSCNDWVIPYLADMVGTTLVFPDARSNRMDVRGTVTWRRRKGTPGMLEQMSAELTGVPVVSQEGWKRLLVAQDLNLLRRERTIADARDPLLAETARGPLDASFHAADLRAISASAGRYHPRHMVHWVHPTRYFPLVDATPARWTGPGSGPQDHRWTFDPLGRMIALGARRTSVPIATDKVPPLHFKARPDQYFGNAESYFDVRVCGLSTGIPEAAARAPVSRLASDIPAEPALVHSAVSVSLLWFTPLRLTGAVRIEVLAAEVDATTGLPVLPGKRRGGIELGAGGAAPLPGSMSVDYYPVVAPVALIRLTTASGQSEHFPGAVVEITGSENRGALRASSHEHLAVEGFLRGAITAELPAGWITSECLWYLAADGSLYATAGAPLVAGPGGTWRLPGVPLTTGPGAAWPPAGVTASTERLTRLPTAPGRGPVFMHGGRALAPAQGVAQIPVSADTAMALVIAAYRRDSGRDDYQPFLRLIWNGPDPAAGRWHAVAPDGSPAGDLRARFRAIAALRSESSLQLGLHVRLESNHQGVILPPCELAIATDDGTPVLVYLPELVTAAQPSDDRWPAGLAHVSEAVSILVDGSTQATHSQRTRRYSHGAIAPLAGAATLRRRLVRHRALAPRQSQSPANTHAPAPYGHLDIDPGSGLFAMGSAPQPYPRRADIPGAAVPASVTVAYQEGYTDHTGARPAPREPELGAALPAPTRLVCGHGVLHRHAPAAFHDIPMYPTLAAALAAIAQDAQEGTAATREVVQFEDSATYVEPLPVWPAKLAELVIQAAENERPVIRFAAAAAGPQPVADWQWRAMTLRGLCIALDPAVAAALTLPPVQQVELQYCTAATESTRLRFEAPAAGTIQVAVHRCVTAALTLSGAGTLRITDSVVDAGQSVDAITAVEATCDLARVTVRGRTQCLIANATEVIFLGDLIAANRFAGCVRYSRITATSETPRRHHVQVATAGDADARVVTWDRASPAHARLSEQASGEIQRGAEDGSEMGAFQSLHTPQRHDGLTRRLVEYTPAGLITGIIRVD